MDESKIKQMVDIRNRSMESEQLLISTEKHKQESFWDNIDELPNPSADNHPMNEQCIEFQKIMIAKHCSWLDDIIKRLSELYVYFEYLVGICEVDEIKEIEATLNLSKINVKRNTRRLDDNEFISFVKGQNPEIPSNIVETYLDNTLVNNVNCPEFKRGE